MADSLKQKTITGLKWSGVEKLFQQVFVFVSGILLARMLEIEDYGMITVLAIFSYMANAIQDSGLAQALVRKKDVTDNDYNTAFYFNICIALALYGILFFMAPYIARFYEKEQLTWLARFIFLSFVFNAFGAVQYAQAIRSINYKLIAKIGVLSIFISYVITLALAYFGFGAWALAFQLVSLSFLKNLFLWIGNKWKPKFIFSWGSFKELFGFGSSLLLKSILDTVTTRITPNVIGKYLGLHTAGIYESGSRLYNSGFDFLSGTIFNVTYPVMSKVDTDIELKRIFRKIVRATSFIVFPFFLGIVLVAKPFIVFFLGVKWQESVEVLQLLSISGIFLSLNYLYANIIKIKGKTYFILVSEIAYTAIIFLTLFVAIYLKWNVYDIILGMIAGNFIRYIISLVVVEKLLHYRVSEHLKDIVPYLSVTVVSIGLGYLLSYVISNDLFLFLSQLIVVVVLYFGITYFSGSVIIKELVSIIKKKGI